MTTVVIACFTLSKGTLTHPAEPHETCRYRISCFLDGGAAMTIVASSHLHLHCYWYLVFCQAAPVFFNVLCIWQRWRSMSAAVGQENTWWKPAQSTKWQPAASINKLLNCNSRKGWDFKGTQLCAHVSDYFQLQWQRSKLTAYAQQTTKHIIAHQSTDTTAALPQREIRTNKQLKLFTQKGQWRNVSSFFELSSWSPWMSFQTCSRHFSQKGAGTN